MQGWRISMEDAHTTVLDLLAAADQDPSAHASKLSFFGVFDGHGGDKVALFAGENIHRIIAKQDAFKAGNYEQALKDGFLATDRAILNGIYTDMSLMPPPFLVMAAGRSGFAVVEWHFLLCQRQFPNARATQTRSTKRKFPAARLAWG